MDNQTAIWLVLVVALVAANWPYLSHRILLVGPLRRPKSAAWLILELALLACLTLALGFALEAKLGQRHPQRWEFYAAGVSLFITLGFPGFVWRYLRRSRHES